MTLRTLHNVKDNILVVGSIYNHLDKIDKIRTIMPNYHTIIFNGNLLFPFDNIDEVRSRIKIMNDLIKLGNVIYNLGNYDLKLLNILNQNNEHFDVQEWIVSNPNVIGIDFNNTSSALIVSGGLTPDIKTRAALNDNLEVSFVSYINDKPWQVYYGGWLGYVISNNPSTTKEPIFYPYAGQLGTKYSKSQDVYAQEIEPYGLKNLIKL